jgi:transcriptional antiterminator NusG
MMAVDRKDLERAVAINTDRVVIARQRAKERTARQNRFLATAAGNEHSHRAWFVVTTANNHEKAVYNRLLDAGIQAWLPVEIEQIARHGSRPAITKERVCWPGYIFVFVVPVAESWAGMAAIKGVTSILTDGEKPISMKDKAVKKLKELVLAGEIFRKEKREVGEYRIGERVRVLDGPFALFQGVVEFCKPDVETVRVDVAIFGRETPVWLALDQIERVR